MLVGKVWNAAIGQSKTKPSSLEMMYMSPLFCDMMMSGLRYLTHILQLRDFSMAVFLIKMRSPSLKLYLMMVVACSCSKLIVALIHVVYMSETSVAR